MMYTPDNCKDIPLSVLLAEAELERIIERKCIQEVENAQEEDEP